MYVWFWELAYEISSSARGHLHTSVFQETRARNADRKQQKQQHNNTEKYLKRATSALPVHYNSNSRATLNNTPAWVNRAIVRPWWCYWLYTSAEEANKIFEHGVPTTGIVVSRNAKHSSRLKPPLHFTVTTYIRGASSLRTSSRVARYSVSWAT